VNRTQGRLVDQSADFAQRLTDLLNGTVTKGARVTSALLTDRGRSYALVAPGAKESAPGTPETTAVPLSLLTLRRDRERAPLWLALFFRMILDPEQEWAAVQKSSFRLCINKDTMRQAIRIEYDRQMKPGRAAHVHIHGTSSDLGFAFGAVAIPPPPLEKLHVPVGGHRFRPCLEDFIEFLKEERLIKRMQPGWRRVLEASREEFMDRQVRAAVRRNQAAAADELIELGWEVREPE
jgi:hypothetical protein